MAQILKELKKEKKVYKNSHSLPGENSLPLIHIKALSTAPHPSLSYSISSTEEGPIVILSPSLTLYVTIEQEGVSKVLIVQEGVHLQ